MRGMNRSAEWLFAPRRTPIVQPQVRRNTSIGGLSFAAEVDGEHVPMRISENALWTLFGALRCRSTWLEAYRRNASEIDACAIAVYLQDPQRPVCLETSDFRPAAN